MSAFCIASDYQHSFFMTAWPRPATPDGVQVQISGHGETKYAATVVKRGRDIVVVQIDVARIAPLRFAPSGPTDEAVVAVGGDAATGKMSPDAVPGNAYLAYDVPTSPENYGAPLYDTASGLVYGVVADQQSLYAAGKAVPTPRYNLAVYAEAVLLAHSYAQTAYVTDLDRDVDSAREAHGALLTLHGPPACLSAYDATVEAYVKWWRARQLTNLARRLRVDPSSDPALAEEEFAQATTSAALQLSRMPGMPETASAAGRLAKAVASGDGVQDAAINFDTLVTCDS